MICLFLKASCRRADRDKEGITLNNRNQNRQRNQVGRLIRYERKKAGMSLDELCEGLCSHTFLMRVESGERTCEKILADALLQRVGVSADKFVYMMNPEEQEWLLLWDRIQAAVDSGHSSEAKQLMAEYRELTEKRSKLHRQRLLLAEGILRWKDGEDATVVSSTLAGAWEITKADAPVGVQPAQRLTITEFVVAMTYFRIREEHAQKEEAAAGYEALVQYLEDYIDEEDSVKLLPQLAYRLIPLYLAAGRGDRAVQLAEKSVALLKVRGRLFHLRYFLRIMIDHGALTPEEAEDMRKICESLEWLYAEFQVSEESWRWDVSYGMLGIEDCGSLIRARRMALGMTQEQLAEGICDPVSVSRIERNEVAPKRQIFERLMERVGMTGSSFEALTQMEAPELMDLAVRISVLLGHSKGAEAEPLIGELEKRMEKPDRFARQFLQSVRALALWEQKKLTAEEHAAAQTKALYLTLPKLPPENLEKWCFSYREISIINMLSYSCDRLGSRKELIRLLEIIRRQLEEKPFSLEHYIANYELTMRNLGNLLGNAARYEEAVEISKIGIRNGLQAGRGSIVAPMLYDCGWDMEKLWETGSYTRKDSLCYMKACYSLELLLGRAEEYAFTKRHIREYYAE